MSELDLEEKEITTGFESGKLKAVKDLPRKLARHRRVAEATFKKDSRINIRISSKDRRGLQKRALAEGIPYQTLVSSILHKFVEGKLVDRPRREAKEALPRKEIGR